MQKDGQVKVNANDLLTQYKQRVSDLEFQNMVLALQVAKLQKDNDKPADEEATDEQEDN